MSPPTTIPSVNRFITALNAALGKGVLHTLNAASNGADVYEAYLMAIVIRAAKDLHMGIAIEDTSGAPKTTLQLRTSPSSITSGNFTHVVLSRPSSTDELLEVHTGIYVQGTSGVRHECDVVILKRDAGLHCRQHPRSDPRSSAVVWAMEAKFYVTNVGLAKAREYFGLNLEMSGKKSRRTALVVTRSTSSVQKLFTHHTPVGHFYSDVYPGQLTVDNLRSYLRQVLGRCLS
jgi:hypothetical protein